MSEFTVEQKEMLDDEYSKLIYRNEQLEADYNELGELYDNLMEQFEDLQRQVDTQKMINTLKESQPDQITRTYSRQGIIDLYAGFGSGNIEKSSRKVIGINGTQDDTVRTLEMFKNNDGNLFNVKLNFSLDYRLKRIE